MYWHYWTDGHKVLNEVLDDVVRMKQPDMGFCLCWANHSWTKCAWNGYKSTTMLMEQKYPGEEDHRRHFVDLIDVFKDERYTRVNGKLLFGIFAPFSMPNVRNYMKLWNKLAKENNLGGFYFVALNKDRSRSRELLDFGFDAVIEDLMDDFRQNCYSYVGLPFRILRKFFGIVFGNKYEDYCNFMLKNYIDKNGSIPCIYPNWDHSARSGKMATIFRNADPNIWGRLCKGIFESCKQKPSEENLIIIKSWNEWGEGNYLEPDRRYKRGYIEELRAALDSK